MLRTVIKSTNEACSRDAFEVYEKPQKLISHQGRENKCHSGRTGYEVINLIFMASNEHLRQYNDSTFIHLKPSLHTTGVDKQQSKELRVTLDNSHALWLSEDIEVLVK